MWSHPETPRRDPPTSLIMSSDSHRKPQQSRYGDLTAPEWIGWLRSLDRFSGSIPGEVLEELITLFVGEIAEQRCPEASVVG